MELKFLKSLESIKDYVFHEKLQRKPMGKYAHIIILRETKSFNIFQTDGNLNTANVRKGLKDESESRKKTDRIVMFKRKQTSPERSQGSISLREKKINIYDLIDKKNEELVKSLNSNHISKDYILMSNCHYNSSACKICPDCIIYGFAIGDSGSERSKILTDSNFSINCYEKSHLYATFNGTFDGTGTLHKYESSEVKVTQSKSLGSTDHTIPEIFFPSIVTIQDPTELSLLYVLSLIQNTKKYGAQVSRTGSMDNHIIGVIFSNRDIFSNLKLTQAIYDELENKEEFDYFDVEEASIKAIDHLLTKEPFEPTKIIINSSDSYLSNDTRKVNIKFSDLEKDFLEVTQNKEKEKYFMEELVKECINYSFEYGVLHLKPSNPTIYSITNKVIESFESKKKDKLSEEKINLLKELLDKELETEDFKNQLSNLGFDDNSIKKMMTDCKKKKDK